MAITYDQLRQRIAHKAGYTTTVASLSTAQAENVEMALKSALSRFFDPPILPGERQKHQWSFLTPTLTFDLIEGQFEYDLPHSFVAFEGPLIYVPGSYDWHPPIVLAGADAVMKLQAQIDSTGIPEIAGVRIKATQDVSATQWELVIAPTPQNSYQVKAKTRINPAIPGQASDVPLGGQPHDQTLINACIAEIVSLLVDEGDGGQAEARFIESLRSSISHDRHVSGARTLGYVSDPGVHCPWEAVDPPPVTYKGVVY